MGLFSSKKKQSTDTTTATNNTTSGTSTNTPNVPDWLLKPAQTNAAGLTALQGQGASAYTPGISALQLQANAGAANLGSFPGYGSVAPTSAASTAATDPFAPGNTAASAKAAAGVLQSQGGQSGSSIIDGLPGGQKAETAGAAASPTSGTGSIFADAANQINGINYTPSTVGTSQVGTSQVGGSQVQAGSLLDGLQSYMSPYTNDVVNTTLAGLDKNAGETRAAQAAKEAATGSFRGSRAGIAEGETNADLAMTRAQTEAQLRDQAFTTGAGLSNSDADRRQAASTSNAANSLSASGANAANTLSASTSNASNGLTASGANASNGITANGQRLTGAGLLAGIGVDQGNDARANVAEQGTLGSAQTALENQIKQYPLEYQQQLEGLFAGLDPSLFTGSTGSTTGTSSGTSTGNSTTTKTGSLGAFLADYLLAMQSGGGK